MSRSVHFADILDIAGMKNSGRFTGKTGLPCILISEVDRYLKMIVCRVPLTRQVSDG